MQIYNHANMLNSMRHLILQISKNNQNLPRSIAYQFRVEKPIYYPNRNMEKQSSSKDTHLVTELQEKKRQPRDYYYKILGVKKQATTQQIKAAYYALAKLFHPDASNTPRETKRFQEISNAYHILSDESKRLEYDQLGTIADEHNFLTQAVQGNLRKTNIHQQDRATREELIQRATGEPRLDLTFLEAAHGLKKSLDLRFLKKCPNCHGRAPRLVSQAKPEKCQKCGGTGKLSKRTPTYSCLITCDQCEGRRFTHKNHCASCDNRGIVLETTKVTVPVPSGVKTGDTVTVENPKTNQPVNYRIQVLESEIYKREGNDVCSDQYLTLSQAILGGKCKIRGIYEEIDVEIEPGTESHSKVVVKGKGIRTREGGIGDHIITFKVRIPRNLTMKQRQLIMALSKTENSINI